MKLSYELFLLALGSTAKFTKSTYTVGIGACVEDTSIGGFQYDCPVSHGGSGTLVFNAYEADCTTAYTGDITATLQNGNNIRLAVPESTGGASETMCLTVHSETTGDGLVMALATLNVDIVVNVDGSLSFLDQAGDAIADVSEQVSESFSMTGGQCDGNNPGVGQQLCMDLGLDRDGGDATDMAVITSIDTLTITNDNAGSYNVLGTLSDVGGSNSCASGGAMTCQILTTLPNLFYNGASNTASGSATITVTGRRMLRATEEVGEGEGDSVTTETVAFSDVPLTLSYEDTTSSAPLLFKGWVLTAGVLLVAMAL